MQMIRYLTGVFFADTQESGAQKFVIDDGRVLVVAVRVATVLLGDNRQLHLLQHRAERERNCAHKFPSNNGSFIIFNENNLSFSQAFQCKRSGNSVDSYVIL